VVLDKVNLQTGFPSPREAAQYKPLAGHQYTKMGTKS
jgi:hypothetical protein